MAHIYAADALTIAPRDEVRNTLLIVEDILDAAESSRDVQLLSSRVDRR